MGNAILGRMDEMGTRMDELEESIAALMNQAGLEQQREKVPPTTPRSSFDTKKNPTPSPSTPSSVEI